MDFVEKQLVLILLTFLVKFSLSEANTVPCILKVEETKCDIEKLNLTEENSHFTPSADNPEKITIFDIQASTIYTLPTGICTIFPNIQLLYADGHGIVEIHQDTFKNCQNVHTIWLSINKISYIDPLTFYNLEKLQTLQISQNNLFDFDVESLVSKLPNIKNLYLGKNNFRCGRFKEMITFLKNKNINLGTEYNENQCLNDEMWKIKILESDAKNLPKNMKNFPLTQIILDSKIKLEGLEAKIANCSNNCNNANDDKYIQEVNNFSSKMTTKIDTLERNFKEINTEIIQMKITNEKTLEEIIKLNQLMKDKQNSLEKPLFDPRIGL